MSRQGLLPSFKLADGDGRERPFDDFLADLNVILLTHSRDASHSTADEFLRSFVAECRGVDGVSVRGFDIRSHDTRCDQCCGPHLIFEGHDLVAICDCGCAVRRHWHMEGAAWILIVDAQRNVLDNGPLADFERLVLQTNLDIALSPHRTARAPPGYQHTGRSDSSQSNLAVVEQETVRLSEERTDRPG